MPPNCTLKSALQRDFQEGPEQENTIEERNFSLSFPGVLKNREMKHE